MKKLFLFMALMFMSILNVSAEACDTEDIKRLKELAEGVEITYELQEPHDNGETVIYDYYTIKVSGLTEEIFIYDEKNNIYYTFNDNEKTFVDSGLKKFVVKANGCSNILKTIKLKLPYYNSYYTSSYCMENKNVDICKKWVDTKVDEGQFVEEINSSNTVEEQSFIKGHSLEIIIGIALIFIIVIVIIIKRRREVLV